MKKCTVKFLHFSDINLVDSVVPCVGTATRRGKIHFVVSMENPEHHLYHVIMQCKGLQKDSLDFSMPVWSPGYYRIMDYSQNVLNFRVAGENGKSLVEENR